MAFFDNLSEMLSEKGKEAATAAKKVAEIANLKGRISGVETEIKKNYRKIGEAYFEAYKDAEVSCEFEEYVQAIRDAKVAIADLTSKLNELKGDVPCKGCGSVVKAGSAFCPNCGTKIEVEYFDEEDNEEESDSSCVVDDSSDDLIVEDTDEVEELEEVIE